MTLYYHFLKVENASVIQISDHSWTKKKNADEESGSMIHSQAIEKQDVS